MGSEGTAFAVNGKRRVLANLAPAHLAYAPALGHHVTPSQTHPAMTQALTADTVKPPAVARQPQTQLLQFFAGYVPSYFDVPPNGISNRTKPAGRASLHGVVFPATELARYTTCINLHKPNSELPLSAELAYGLAVNYVRRSKQSDPDTMTDEPISSKKHSDQPACSTEPHKADASFKTTADTSGLM